MRWSRSREEKALSRVNPLLRDSRLEAWLGDGLSAVRPVRIVRLSALVSACLHPLVGRLVFHRSQDRRVS